MASGFVDNNWCWWLIWLMTMMMMILNDASVVVAYDADDVLLVTLK